MIVNNCIYISYNFNNSLFDSEFPCKLKEADITPAYKKERNIENCPPVRTLPNFCKVYERSMYDQISACFETILSKVQCDFRKIYSAWQHWEINAVVFDKCGFSGLLMTDLLKTFDCIDHVVLIAKMHAYGFDIKPLKLKFKI